MKVRFWGTRGSIARPGPDTLRYGGNTLCTEIRTTEETLLVIDCGTGIQSLGQELLKNGPKPLRGTILISHTHWDHIQGFPFFAPLFAPGNEWDIYGPRGLGQSLRDALAGQMQYTYFPITLEALGSTVRFHDLVEGVFQVDDIVVRTQYLNHPALTLGYRIEADGIAVVHASDHEPYQKQSADGTGALGEQDRRHADFLRKADLVIHDAQYTSAEYQHRIGWGHSTIDYAAAVCRQANARRLALTHHDPMRFDPELARIEKAAKSQYAPLDVFAAAEGMIIDLAAPSHPDSKSEADAFSAVAPVTPSMWEHSILIGASETETAALLLEASRSEGIEASIASTPEAAIELMRTSHPSLIFFDEQFATDPSVIAAIETLGGPNTREFPVVVIAETEMDALDYVSDWLIKPFTIQYLRTRMRAWVLKNTCRWVRAKLPPNEERRVAALRKLNILDSEYEDRFDRVTRLASSLFNVPISLISLVDRDRQWFKSCFGHSKRGSTRDTSFCSHAILNSDVMIVPDTLLDNRFADHPSVVEKPRFRFYAGYPLSVADGYRVGTLCILDTRPRELSEAKISLLRDLGKIVERELAKTDGTPVRSAG